MYKINSTVGSDRTLALTNSEINSVSGGLLYEATGVALGMAFIMQRIGLGNTLRLAGGIGIFSTTAAASVYLTHHDKTKALKALEEKTYHGVMLAVVLTIANGIFQIGINNNVMGFINR